MGNTQSDSEVDGGERSAWTCIACPMDDANERAHFVHIVNLEGEKELVRQYHVDKVLQSAEVEMKWQEITKTVKMQKSSAPGSPNNVADNRHGLMPSRSPGKSAAEGKTSETVDDQTLFRLMTDKMRKRDSKPRPSAVLQDVLRQATIPDDVEVSNTLSGNQVLEASREVSRPHDCCASPYRCASTEMGKRW